MLLSDLVHVLRALRSVFACQTDIPLTSFQIMKIHQIQDADIINLVHVQVFYVGQTVGVKNCAWRCRNVYRVAQKPPEQRCIRGPEQPRVQNP